MSDIITKKKLLLDNREMFNFLTKSIGKSKFTYETQNSLKSYQVSNEAMSDLVLDGMGDLVVREDGESDGRMDS